LRIKNPQSKVKNKITNDSKVVQKYIFLIFWGQFLKKCYPNPYIMAMLDCGHPILLHNNRDFKINFPILNEMGFPASGTAWHLDFFFKSVKSKKNLKKISKIRNGGIKFKKLPKLCNRKWNSGFFDNAMSILKGR
jgi:hypothetical protein